MRKRRDYLKLVGAGLVGTVAGCNDTGTDTGNEGNDDGSGAGTSDTTTTVTPTATLTPTATDSGTTTTDTDEGTEVTTTETRTTTTATGTSTTTASPTTTASTTASGPGMTTQNGELLFTGGASGDHFGYSVALTDDGSRALVGARRDDTASGDDAGAAYVFEESGGTWSQTAELTPDDGEASDRFGQSVALAGTTALVGTDNAKTAYVFERSNGTWSQTATLDGEGVNYSNHLALSSDGTTALVSSDDVSVFEKADDTWSEVTTLQSGKDRNVGFPSSLALDDSGETAVVGAPLANRYDSDNDGFVDSNTGAVFVFDGSGESWSRTTELTPDDESKAQDIGDAVSIADDGSTVAAGAPGSNPDDDSEENGAVYVFEEADSWSQAARIASPVTDDDTNSDRYGSEVALSDDTGSQTLLASTIDSVYVHERSGDGWTQQAVLDDGKEGDAFGKSLAVNRDGSVRLVGDDLDDNAAGTDAGAAHVFES